MENLKVEEVLFDEAGFDKDGFSRLGFNEKGIHKITGDFYDKKGIDVNGCNRDGDYVRKIPKLLNVEKRSDKLYLKILEDYYSTDTERIVLFKKYNLNTYKVQKIEDFFVLNFPLLAKQAIEKGKLILEIKIKYHEEMFPKIIYQIDNEGVNLNGFLNALLDIETLMKIAYEKDNISSNHFRALHNIKNDLKIYKEPFCKDKYLKMGLSINGLEITDTIVDCVLKYMKKHDIYICNYTVQDMILKQINEKGF